MRQRLAVVAAIAAALLAYPSLAHAQGIRWTDAELAEVSSAVVTGKVLELASARDPEVGYIYTYVTVEVTETIKGRVSTDTIVLKQLGGRVGDLEMVVYDQAKFTAGEEVLLFLTERPRDRTLVTTALWQGKWNIDRDPESGDGFALRSPFGERGRLSVEDIHDGDDVRLLRPFRALLDEWVGSEWPLRPSGRPVRGLPAERPPAELFPVGAEAGSGADETSSGFTLLGSGSRWHQADASRPVPVDVHAAGQSGLAGGGVSEIAAARAMWNAGGSSLTLVAGNEDRAGGYTATQVCNDSNTVDNRLTIYFGDPCNEIANDGVLAIGGFYSSGSDARNVNGTDFRKIVKGFVINSDESGVRSWLTTSRCFQDVQVHEIGHAIGLGHTSVGGNIMLPTIDNACLSANVGALSGGLGPDDLAGLRFIYPGSVAGGPAAPGSLTATVTSETQVELRWRDNSRNEDGFKMQWRPPGGTWKGIWHAADKTSYVNTGLTAGTYCYRIRSYNAAGHSDYVLSTPECVTVTGGAPPPVVGPAAPSNLVASVDAAERVLLSWTDNADNETGFKMQRQPAGGTWKGIWHSANQTSYVDAGLAPGTYCYRIRSYNDDNYSSYTLSAPNCVTVNGDGGVTPPLPTGGPAAPTNLVASVASGNQINLYWADNSNNEQGFKVQRRPPGGTWRGIWIGANRTGYADRDLVAGTYCYRIRSYNKSGYSSYTLSSPDCVSGGGGGAPAPTPAPTPSNGPAPPTNLVASVVSANRVNLSWRDNSGNEQGFKMQRQTPGGTWKGIWIGSNRTGYGDRGLAPGTYCYRIRSYNKKGYSAYTYSTPTCVVVGG